MSDKTYECMMFDAHLPSGTIRLQAPRDFPLAGGIFEIRRVRTVTPEDEAKFAEYPDPPNEAFSDCELCNG